MNFSYAFRLICCTVSAALIAVHTAPAGLVGYWDFNEGTGTTAYDYTVNDNDGTLTSIGGGVPTWIAGQTGVNGDYALHFSQGNVTVPDSASLHITSTFTLAAWYWDSGSNYGHIFVAGDGDANGRNWLLQTSNYGGDAAYFWSGSGANGEFNRSLGYVPPLNAWHHLAFTYDGSHMRSFVDGSQVGDTHAVSSALDTWGTLRLGGFSIDGSGFEGYLDEMVIFNTVEDVSTIMNGTHLQMLGHWTGGGSGPSYGWSDAANWGGTLPRFNRPLVFDTGNALTANVNDFPAGESFKGITFLSTAGAFTLAGSSVALTGDIVNNSTDTQTISLTGGLVLGGSRDCTFAATAGELVITDGISDASGQICGVIKSGANKVTVSGNLTYGGDTTVAAGVLALGSPNLDNDASTVSIASSAKLELNFTAGATDQVRALFIDGAPMPDGVYGSTDSGATPPDDTHFGGFGTLTVDSTQRLPTTFYVSKSTGNDTWSGEVETPGGGDGPWETLARASTVDLVPGDRILLKCGDTWDEELQPKGNGTAATPILIGSYGSGNRPIIDRGDAAQQNGIHLIDQEGYKIVGIEFSHCETGIWAEYNIDQPVRDFLWIEDCYFHDSLRYGTYYDYYNAKNISVGISLWTFVSWSPDISLQNVTVTNCTFRRMASAFWTNSPDNFDWNADNFYNFANVNILDCLFEEGYQWQLGFRGIIGGRVENCVTHDIGRLNNFVSFNGVAGGMFYRVKNYAVTDSEWGFVSRGGGSADGETFDLEGNNDNITFTRCLFHDADGPGFMLYRGCESGNFDHLFTNCVFNGKAAHCPYGQYPKVEIFNASPGYNQAEWANCRFYLSENESQCNNYTGLTFTDCLTKNLSAACSTTDFALSATASASSQQSGFESAMANDGNATSVWLAESAANEWLQLEFASPTTVNEFRIREEATSSIIRYTIECWDEVGARWVGCFNGRSIGDSFIAPIVSRTTSKVRLSIAATSSGNPGIVAFEAYNGIPDIPSATVWAVGDDVWDIDNAANWKDTLDDPVTYVEGAAVTLDDTASGSSPITITLNTDVSPYSVTANNTDIDYILTGSGSIAGAATLSKDGSGILTLDVAATYTGRTRVNGGILSAGNLGTGAFSFQDATLQYTGISATASLIDDSATGNAYIDVTIGELTITHQQQAKVKRGAGTLTLINDSVSGGSVAVEEGTLVLAGTTWNHGLYNNVVSITDVMPGATVKFEKYPGDSAWHDGQITSSGSFTMSGGTLDLNGANVYGSWLATWFPVVGGSGTISNSVPGTTVVAGMRVAADVGFSGNIVDGLGNVGIALSGGANTWTLSGVNTYSGPTTIGDGKMQAGSTTAFSPNSAYTVNAGKTLDLNGFDNTIGSLAGAGTVTLGAATLTVGNDGTSPAAFSGAISGNGGLTKIGGGTITLTGAGNSYTGDTKVLDGALSISYAYLPDAADVYLQSGAFLNLNSAGETDMIRRLYINGVQKTGIWGAKDSGAPNESSLITGSGKLDAQEPLDPGSLFMFK